jgi:hypothetical protein
MNRTRLFVSYAHEDEFWRDLLLTHMAILETNGMIHVWADSRIEIGADWRLRIQEALDDSRMAILLLSSSFLRSTFIIGTEVPALMKAHIERGMEVLPVIRVHGNWSTGSLASRFGRRTAEHWRLGDLFRPTSISQRLHTKCRPC